MLGQNTRNIAKLPSADASPNEINRLLEQRIVVIKLFGVIASGAQFVDLPFPQAEYNGIIVAHRFVDFDIGAVLERRG